MPAPFRLCLSLICSLPATLPAAATEDGMYPLSLHAVANRGLRDAVAGDDRGGWTDQGPDNDLSTLSPGRLVAAEVPFEIAAPGELEAPTVLVLGNVSQKVARDPGEAGRAEDSISGSASPALRSATLSLGTARPARYLYLLHAAASPTAGTEPFSYLTFNYADGVSTRQELINRRDVGNWRDPLPASNAGVGWESENPTAAIGLYVSRFPLEARPLTSITFELAGGGAWMIAAATVSDRAVDVGVVPQTFVVTPGAEWAPYAHSLDVAPGGVFDYSFLQRAPAGRDGPLRATAEGHFEFAGRPGTRVRFWGVNLCFSAQFLEKAEADLLAERLARSGYNTVRFHHFDGTLTRGQAVPGDLDAAALDQLDYLFAALKRRGLHLNIDLFSSRSFSPAELAEWGVPPELRSHFKSLVPINEGAYAAWARFATQLLSHRNPYTGLTWAEDPALIGICPINENPLFNRVESPASLQALYAEAFAASGLPGPASSSNPDFNRFIHELNRRSDARMAAHLRSLGTQALLTGANYTISQGLAYVREAYDYVDCHSYWDHPKFPVRAWSLPNAFGQGSSVRARAKMPARIMPTRIFGRPFVSTEFNFCRPNRHRMEGAILMPAYASLQDWDGLYNFQYAMNRTMAVQGGVENTFAIANDPIGLVGDRVGSLLFQRGDIAPARRAVAYAVQSAEAFSSLGRLFPGEFSPLGLVSRIGSLPGTPDDVLTRTRGRHNVVAVVTGDPLAGHTDGAPRVYAPDESLAATLQADGALPAGSISAAQRVYRSDTGEIELDATAGTVRVITPRSELFLLAPGGEAEGASTAVRNGGTRGVVGVVALPTPGDAVSVPLTDARRMLVVHLADALPQGMQFSHHDRKLLQAWGEGPHLLERAEATLRLTLPGEGWRAWAVDATGARTHELPLRRQGDRWSLELRTVSERGTQLAYELAR